MEPAEYTQREKEIEAELKKLSHRDWVIAIDGKMWSTEGERRALRALAFIATKTKTVEECQAIAFDGLCKGGLIAKFQQ